MRLSAIVAALVWPPSVLLMSPRFNWRSSLIGPRPARPERMWRERASRVLFLHSSVPAGWGSEQLLKALPRYWAACARLLFESFFRVLRGFYSLNGYFASVINGGLFVSRTRLLNRGRSLLCSINTLLKSTQSFAFSWKLNRFLSWLG